MRPRLQRHLSNALRSAGTLLRDARRYPAARRRLREAPLHWAIQTVVVGTYGGAVWGDECMARGLAAALVRRGHRADVVSAVSHDIPRLGCDVMVAMYPTGPLPGLPYRIELPRVCLNLYWAQVPGHIRLAAGDRRFRAWLFASRTEMQEALGRPSLWFPMAADPEAYRPVPSPLSQEVAFCANHPAGRTPETLRRYLAPAFDLLGSDLVIRGTGWEGTPYAAASRGPIHPGEVPSLYSSSKLVLSIHGDLHRSADMPTSRLFEAAACRSAIVSDELPTARELFGDTIAWTTGGDELRTQLVRLLGSASERERIAHGAHEVFRQHGTFDVQARRLEEFVRKLATHA